MKTKYFTIIAFVVIIIGVVTYSQVLATQQIITQEIQPSYVADFSQDDILLGSSHNIFIARIIKQSGEKTLGVSPETQFKVEVISNIKGDLHGTIIVDQFGGYKDGVLYTVFDDNPTPNAKSADSYMLQEGNTYLLATRYNETEDWYTLNSFYTASKLLSTDKEMKMSELKALADNDDRVKALKEAYPKEKLLDADIQHNNTKNSFVSLSVEEQEKIKAEVEQMKTGTAQTKTSEPTIEITIPQETTSTE